MLKKETNLLKKVLKKSEQNPFLYNDEELVRIKNKLRQLKNWRRSAQISQNNGFGQYINNNDDQNDDD